MNKIINNAKVKMQQTIEFLKRDLSTISAGKASPNLLNGVKVKYYEEMVLLNQISSISTPEPRQIVIKPYEKTQNEEIVSAINKAKLDLNPVIDGDIIRINIPSLTEESRKKQVKVVKEIVEKSKISIRTIRHQVLDQIKKEDINEDLEREGQNKIKELVNQFNTEIDQISKEKEKHLLEI